MNSKEDPGRETLGWSKELKKRYFANQAELSDNIDFDVLDSKLYEYLKRVYIADIRGAVQHIDSCGRVIGAEGLPLVVGEDSPYVKGLLIFSNGPNLDSYISNMITRTKEPVQGPIKLSEFNTLDDFVHVKKNTPSNDVTLFYNDKTGDIKWVFSPVKNHYDGVDEMGLIESLPNNYLFNMDRQTCGKRTSVALVNSAKYPINAVILKQSGGGGLGLLTHVAGGLIIQTGYAMPRKTKNGVAIDYVEDSYVPYKDGVVLDTEKKTRVPLINSENNLYKIQQSETSMPVGIPQSDIYPPRAGSFVDARN